MIINKQLIYRQSGVLKQGNNDITFIGIQVNKQLDVKNLYSIAEEIYRYDTKKNIYDTSKIRIYFTDDNNYAHFEENSSLSLAENEKRFVLGYVEFNRANSSINPEIENHLNLVDWKLEPTKDEYQRYNDFKIYLKNNRNDSFKINNDFYNNLYMSTGDLELLENKFKMNEKEIDNLITKIELWRNVCN